MKSPQQHAAGQTEFSVGDEVRFGKYKNQCGKIVRFFDDDRGVPSVEIEPVPKGRKKNRTMGLYKIWKAEAQQKQACIVFSKKCDGDVVLGKVRDRMYNPSLCVYHLEVDGTEICILFDRITGFCEGINEHGIGIVNSSLMVLQDEREGLSEGDSDPERSPDGIKIVKALTKKTLPEVLRSLITYKPPTFKRGLKGHTLISDGAKVYALESSKIHTPKVVSLSSDDVYTRTNHGIYYPGAGYTKGDDYISSVVRQWEAKKQLEKVQRAEDLMPVLTQSIEKTDGSLNPVRFTDKMRTTSQMIVNPSKGEILLYLIPEHSKFKGVRNLLPDGRKPKLKVRVFQYPSKKELKDQYVTVPDEMESASAKKSLKRQVMARYKSKKKVKTKDGDEMTVYEYSDRQVADRNRKKAERVEKLRKSMQKLQTKVRKDVQSKDEKTRDVALAVGLMDETFERVGNDGSAKEGHFGVTTWRVKHVKFHNGSATLSYVGKSGVDQKKKITNSRIVSALKKACADKKPNECVLSVSASEVNAYLKPFGISAKDIRGLHANTEMKTQLRKVRKGKLPDDPKEREKKLKDEFKKALEATAERVGHEASTLKSQYLVPGLEDEYMKDGTISESHTKKGAEAVTDTGALYVIAPDALKDMLDDTPWYELSHQMWPGSVAEAVAIQSPDSEATWNEMERHVRESGGAVLETRADGGYDVGIRGRYNDAGELEPFDRPVREKDALPPYGLRQVTSQGTLTERRILANALNAPVLVARDRKWWLREAPNLYRLARDHEKPRPHIPGLKFDPELFTVLWYEDSEGNSLGEPDFDEGPLGAPEGATTQHSQFPNELVHSILQLNDDGTSSEIFRGASTFPGDLVTAMVRSEEWDVGDAIMVAGQSCSRCMNGLAHHYGLKWGIPIDSEEYRNDNTRCSMCKHQDKTGTKSDAEKEEEQVQKMLRKEPKKKPPRYDLRDNRTLDEEDEEEVLGGGDKGDRDLSMKWNKVGHRVAWRWVAAPTRPSSVRLIHRLAEVEAPTGQRQQREAPTFEQWVKDKRWPSKAKNAPPSAEVGFEGLKKQDPPAAEKVRAEYRRQFPGAKEEEGKKEKGKGEEEGKRTREDIDEDLQEVRDEVDELELSVEELQKQIKEHKKNIDKLRRKSRKPPMDPEARKEKIQARIDQEKQKMRETVQRMKPLGKEMDKLEDRSDDLKKEIKSQQKVIKDAKGYLEQLGEDHPQVERFKSMVAEARKAIREADGDFDDVKEALKEKKAEYKSLRKSGRESAKAVEFLEKKLEEEPQEQAAEDPEAQLKEERKKLDETEEELKEKKEDLNYKQQRVEELKAERSDPSGAKRQQKQEKRQQKQEKKREQEKRRREAIERTVETMESLMGKGSRLPRHVKAEIEAKLDKFNDDEMEQFSLEFENTLQKLTDQDPTSDEAVSVANAMAKSGFSTQGQNAPDELGERLAKIAYTRNVVANPMIAGAKPVGQTEMDEVAYGNRALDGYNTFSRLNGILRRDAANKISEELRGLDPETDRAQELSAILTGINTAHVADTGDSLPGQPQVSKGPAALIRRLAEGGNIATMFKPVGDMFADESRQVMRNALNNMNDDELAEFIVGDDPNHPFRRLKGLLQNSGPGGSEYKQLIKSFLIDDWMNDVWGDRATRDVMEAAGATDWDDPDVRAQIIEEAKTNGGPGRQAAFDALVRIDEARARGERPDPQDEQLVQDVLGEGGKGLQESAQSLLDTLKDKFNKWVISPATAVFKNFVETGDKSVMDTETLPHPDANTPEPRTKEDREKARADAPKPAESGQYVDSDPERDWYQVSEKGAKFWRSPGGPEGEGEWESQDDRGWRKRFETREEAEAHARGGSPWPGAKEKKPKEDTPKAQERRKRLDKARAMRKKMEAQREKLPERARAKFDERVKKLDRVIGQAEEAVQDDNHGPGDVWETDQGNWRAKNRKGTPKSFKDKAKAEQYAKGENAPEGREEAEDEGFSADFNIPIEERGPTRLASDKVAELWLTHVQSFHPDDPNRPFIVVEAA